jgi:hypothetical protein
MMPPFVRNFASAESATLRVWAHRVYLEQTLLSIVFLGYVDVLTLMSA